MRTQETPARSRVIGVAAVVALIAIGLGGLVYVFTSPTQAPAESLQIPHADVVPVQFDMGPFDRVCREYVNELGLVDYTALKEHPEDLDEFLNEVAAVSPHSNLATFPGAREALAYWINAYNALMMKAVLQAYPTKSVHDIEPDVFMTRSRVCGGEKLSLDDIETGIVRKEFLDPPSTSV